MSIDAKLIKYQVKLPDSLQVKIKESADGGYYVEIKNLPGCFTQADNIEDLFVMVNDAVYCYFDIPEKYITFMPRYFPREKIRQKLIQAWEKSIPIPKEFLGRTITFSQTALSGSR